MTGEGARSDGSAEHGVGAIVPNVLSGTRVLLGPCFVFALDSSPTTAFFVSVVASATDFVDGRLARRFGVGSMRGAILDVVADAVFVLSGMGALAWRGILSPALPIAAAVSLLALALVWRDSARRPTSDLGVASRGAADRIGHRAGILNYGAVLLGSGFLAFGVDVSLRPASIVAAGFNLLPIALRRWGRGR